MDKRKPTASREEPKVSMPPAPEHGTALPAGDGGVASQAGETAIDLRGLKCPLPALRTRKALSRLPAGAILIVECTDPLAEIDIPHLASETGDELQGKAKRGDVLVFRIRKRG